MAHFDWNDGWLFAPTFSPALCAPACPEEGLEPVRLPHTVRLLPYSYGNENDYQMVCGYRRSFFAPAEWAGHTVLLTFGAAAHDAIVFCNGLRVGHHSCGCTAFTVDLSRSLRFGAENILTVRLDTTHGQNIPPFGGPLEEMTYGGLCRTVSLEVKESSYLKDVYVQAKADGSFRIYSTIEGESLGCTLRAEILNPAGRKAVYLGGVTLPMSGTLNGVQPWSPDRPVLYTLNLMLVRTGSGGLPDRVLDEKSLRFGFRTLQLTQNGLLLNGRRIRLRGLTRSQSYPYQGHAMPDSLQQLDAVQLKRELGCNAVRTTGGLHGPAFLDACDELGLLVIPDVPGWQHLGDEAWRAQALQNCREMVLQARSHPSVCMWSIRVPGGPDDEAFYKKLHEAVRRLDPSRPTCGVHSRPRESCPEDVYGYNDTSFSWQGSACLSRTAVCPSPRKGYLITGYGGQPFPTKPFDDEPHRQAHALGHAMLLNDCTAQPGIVGSIGQSMADFNTTGAFGSGDRIRYHGVCDLFRNPKLAAAVYRSQLSPRSAADVTLSVSSALSPGDHPAGFLGACWAFTNADSVRLYRSGEYIAEFFPNHRRFAALAHPPIEISDFVGSLLEKYEGMEREAARQLADCLNAMRREGPELPPLQRAHLLRVLRGLRLSWTDALRLYRRYIATLGADAAPCRFEAIYQGQPVRTVICEPVQRVRLECTVRNPVLTDGPSWDCAAVQLRAIDQNDNLLPYCGEAVRLTVEGPARLIGPGVVPLRGGMGGTYLATVGEEGPVLLRCRMEGALEAQARIFVRRRG